jgi:hypothetical protein
MVKLKVGYLLVDLETPLIPETSKDTIMSKTKPHVAFSLKREMRIKQLSKGINTCLPTVGNALKFKNRFMV